MNGMVDPNCDGEVANECKDSKLTFRRGFHDPRDEKLTQYHPLSETKRPFSPQESILPNYKLTHYTPALYVTIRFSHTQADRKVRNDFFYPYPVPTPPYYENTENRETKTPKLLPAHNSLHPKIIGSKIIDPKCIKMPS